MRGETKMSTARKSNLKLTKTKPAPYVSTTNACKLCTPLGACLAFRGVAGAVPFLHGSQGCATYMRRYIISHFREPMDIASSSLGEKHAIYGGGPNLKQGLQNVMCKYGPQLIGVATTCLTETIGDNVPMFVKEFWKEQQENGMDLPRIVTVSSPSYHGTHMEGFHRAVRALVDQLVEPTERNSNVNLLPGFVSPADIRHLKEILEDFGINGIISTRYFRNPGRSHPGGICQDSRGWHAPGRYQKDGRLPSHSGVWRHSQKPGHCRENFGRALWLQALPDRLTHRSTGNGSVFQRAGDSFRPSRPEEVYPGAGAPPGCLRGWP